MLFHGKPSGLDVSVVAFESPILFSKEEGPKPIEIGSKPWTLAIINSGNKSSTQSMIDIAAPFFKSEKGSEAIERFNQLADMTLLSLKRKDHDLMAHVMKESQLLLDEAGVVTDELRDIVTRSEKLGILATKITGAGGGGSLLGLLDPKNIENQKKLLREELAEYDIYFTEI